MFKIKNIFEVIVVFAVFAMTIAVWNFALASYLLLPDLVEVVVLFGIVAGFVYGVDKLTDIKKWKYKLSPRVIFMVLASTALFALETIDFSWSILSLMLIGTTIVVAVIDRNRFKNIKKDKLFV